MSTSPKHQASSLSKAKNPSSKEDTPETKKFNLQEFLDLDNAEQSKGGRERAQDTKGKESSSKKS
jgi:hypothetical protein